MPALHHCRGGGQGHRRGPRRWGGRSRPQERGRGGGRGGGAAISEHLDKLSLTSDCSEGPIKAKPQGNQGQHVQRDAQQHERQVSADEPSLETECFKDAAAAVDSSSGGRGVHRGRRRGQHWSTQQQHGGVPGPPPRYHWDGRAPRSRGGGGGGGGGGGPRRGHGVRGYHQRVVERERGREEVL